MNKKRESLKQRLKKGEHVLGTWCILPSPEVINVLAKAGLDFVLIDMEHGAADYKTALMMVMAAQSEGCEAIIRVSQNNEADVLKALDIGANGVIVPHIENSRDRERAISYVKYPPVGIRGFSPYARSGSYTSRPGYTVIENKLTISGIIVEGEAGINNLDEIINDKNLDIVYIGVYDLSAVLKIPGEVNNPKIYKLLKECVDKIRKKGKVAGGLFHSAEELKLFKKIGIQFLCYKVDTSILFDSYNSIIKTKL